MPLQVIEKPRLYRQIADQLRALIDGGEYPPGSCLPAERELAKQLGVSRASVREALIALEVIGLVDVRVGDGVRVCAPSAPPPPDTPVLELAGRGQWAEMDPELSLALDLDAEIPPFALLQARRLVEPEAAALAARHASIAQASGNPAYALLLRHLLGHRYGSMFQLLQRRYTPEDMPDRSQQEHMAILEALEAHDPDAARQAMAAHLDAVTRIFARPAVE